MANPTPVHVDVDVDEDNPRPGSLRVLKIIRPNWKEEEIESDVYPGGISNKLFGFFHRNDESKSDCVIIRIYGKSTELMVDHEVERAIKQILHDKGCGAELYATFNNGFAYEFIIGTCLTTENVRDPYIGRLVAKALVQMHHVDANKHVQDKNIKFDQKTGNLFSLLRRYLPLIPDVYENSEQQIRYEENITSKAGLLAELDILQAHLEKLGSPLRFCHNDALMGNLVLNDKKDKITLIDFEISGYNHVAYDLATHFMEWTGLENIDMSLYPDKNTQLSWLKFFLEYDSEFQGKDPHSVTEKDVEILYIQVQKFTLLTLFACAIWGLVQAGVSTIDFDFMGYSIFKLNEYYKRKEELFALSLPK